MKHTSRKLLSLLMALVMVLSLAPVALAMDPTVSIEGEDTTVKSGTTATFTARVENAPLDAKTTTYTWGVTGNLEISGDNNGNSVTVKGTGTSAGSGTVTLKVSITVPGTGEGAEDVTTDYNATAKNVTVTAPDPAVLTGISLSKSTVTLTMGSKEEETITASAVPDNAELGTLRWESSDETVAEVANGKITAKKAGSAEITAKSGTIVSNKCVVTVKPAVGAATIVLTSDSVEVGKSISGISNAPEGTPSNATVKWTQSGGAGAVTLANDTTNNVTITGKTKGNVTLKVTYTSGGNVVAEATKTLTVTQADLSITTNASNNTLTSYGAECTATAVGSMTDNSSYTYKWTSDKAGIVSVTDTNRKTTTLTAYDTGTATITVNVYNSSTQNASTLVGSASLTVKVQYKYNVNPVVTVNEGSSAYNMADRDDKGDSSVIDQIESLLRNELGSYPYVVFAGVSQTAGYLTAETRTNYYLDRMPSSASSRYNGLLSDVDFIPSKDGTATFEFTVYLDDNKDSSRSGLLTVKVEDGVSASGDITYTASLGEEVSFDPNDFDIFWTDTYSKGTLDHVVFGSVSGGTLKDASGNVRTSDKYYLNPGRNDDDLAEVYFTPSSSTSKKATTIKVPFTAYGSRTGSTGSGYDLEGTISIVYLNDSASDISYSTTNGSVTLNPQDFIDAYKEATGKTASSSTNLTIEFQNVPSIGTLTYTNGSRKTTLTSKNVKNNRYTTKSSGTYRLEQLTYTGTSGKDTIDYIAYSGGTAQFSGKVVFNGTAAIPTNLSIPMSCTSSYGVNMNSGSFTSANATAMAKCSIIRFDRPTGGGTLTYAGTSAVGVSIPFSLVGMVTYTPASGFNGTDRILFVAQDASGNTVASGQVNVTVSGNSGSGNNNNPSSGTPISKMTDVPATAWYRTELSDLMNKGIIAGRTPTSFAPDGTVTYGEALKMVLRAAGYPAQSEPTGNNWAINYKNLAVSNGIIEDSIDLNANITRDKMVEVAAKALKINASTASSPFTDSSNPYAIALYNTYYSGSKGIIGGNPDGTFKGGDTLNRAEMCAIVWRMNTYYAIRYSSVMPDGI